VRYYWTDDAIGAAAERLLDNLSAVRIPENLLSQYLPDQYWAVRNGALAADDPHAIAQDRVRQVIRMYAAACRV
jgi:D-tagatose-1,6-bisphosphate aldolase subunit GatZ/KbaZ